MNSHKYSLWIVCFTGILLSGGCDNESSSRSCDEGTFVCLDSDDAHKAYKQCLNGEWTQSNCDYQCRTLKGVDACVDCEENTIQCLDEDDRQYILCTDGHWSSDKKTCKYRCEKKDTGHICVDDSGKTECSGNEIRCIDNQKYKACQGGLWSDEKSCDYQCQTTENGDACVENPMPDECTGDEIRCIDDKQYKKCVDSTWSEEILGCGSLTCFKDETENSDYCGECKNNSIRCIDDKQYYKCVDGFWSSKTFGCGELTCFKDETSNSDYCAKCTDGMIQCVDDKQYKKCVGDKLSSETFKCPILECVPGSANEPAFCAECNDDKTVCFDGKVQKCVNRVYKEEKTCDFGCSPDHLTCAECDKNSCQDGKIRRCSLGRLGPEETCPGSADCADENRCHACKDNDRRCSDRYTLDLCVDGKWEELEVCKDSGRYCVNYPLMNNPDSSRPEAVKCGTLCGRNYGQYLSKICADSFLNGQQIAASYQCEYDAKEKEFRYPLFTTNTNVSCNLETRQPGECLNNDIRCGHFVPVLDDKGKPTFDENMNYITELDDEHTLYRCDAGTWREHYACQNDCNTQNQQCNACQTDEKTTIRGVELTCVNGFWDKCINADGSSVDCALGCNPLYNQCFDCISGETRPMNNRTSTCVNGLWDSYLTPQNTNKTCQYRYNPKQERCFDCFPGATESAGGETRFCVDGYWNACQREGGLVACERGCDRSSNLCFACTHGETETVGNETRTCKNGFWDKCVTADGNGVIACEYGCNPHTNRCMDCEQGQSSKNPYNYCIQYGRWSYCYEDNGDGTQNRISCPYGCDQSANTCYECVGGETREQGDKTQTCVNGYWKNIA